MIFALLHSDGSLWLKSAGRLAERVAAEGCERWRYSRAGRKPVAMPCRRLPFAALDDPELACNLARDALCELG